MRYLKFIIVLIASVFINKSFAQTQPYPAITAKFEGESIKHSPDPLSGYRWDNPKATDDLEIYTIYPLKVSADETNNFSTNNNFSLIRVTGDCSLMFDFGQVNAGWLEFDSDNLDAEVEISISEFNEPAVFNLGSENPRKTKQPVKYGNTYRLELNKELYEGVRFGWIHIKKLNKPATISAVRLICQVKPTNYEGSFSCSDTDLTRIWYTGAYTVKLNLLKDYFGAILMERSDRHSWTGDAHTSQAASMVAFGNFDFVKTNIRYTSTQNNGIATYSLYWVLSLIDYYNYTGDKQAIAEFLENACNKLNVAYEHYGQNPSLSFCGWDERLGAGFENPDCTESQWLYKMLSIRVWSEFGNTLSHAGYPQLADKYKKYATEKINELRKNPKWATNLGVHSAAGAINAGFTNKKEQETLWKSAFSDRQQRVSYSPFNQFFIIKALAQMQRYPEALNTIDDCWGGQLRYGGTTFFEVFRPSWNMVSQPNDAPINNQCGYTSLTHPWSAGVTKWLTEEILGIKSTLPGFKSCIIKPRLSAELTWVEGSVPTPRGVISASFNTTNGKCTVSIPAGITATVAIPKAGMAVENIRFETGIGKKIKEDKEFVYYTLLQGNYSINVKYKGVADKSPSEPFSYQISNTPSEDIYTKGNWKSKYGKKGYVLCNYDSVGTHHTVLPDFIEGITINKEGNQHWTSSSQDERALESYISNGRTRSLGAMITRDPWACQQTMTIDIKCKQQQQYSVSFYFVDWDNQNRRSAIEVFDLDSKELLMPVYMVRDYEEGKYVTYTFNKSVRVRINQVRGTNAALSAIFFD